jgi:YidC/Oxa1 family membrane protein insertase
MSDRVGCNRAAPIRDSVLPMGLFTEISALVRFFFQTPKSEKAIVFYSEQASYWAYFEGLIGALQRKTDRSICYVTSDPNDPVLSSGNPRIRAFYLNRLLPSFMGYVDCKVFVITLTELNLHHLKRSNQPVHYAYVFHALNSSHMAYRPQAFDHYDSILCCGPYHANEIRRDEELRGLPKKQLVEAGYYRLERLYKAAQEQPASSTEKKVVLVAPSWSANNVLEAHGATLVRTLLNAGYEVIMRPHPETIKRSAELVQAIEDEFRDDAQFTLERSVATDDSILRADVLITDWSGIALEYAFGTERPVLYLDVPRKVHNDSYATLGIEPFEVRMRSEIGVVFPPADIVNIDQAIDRLVREREQYRQRIVELRSDNIFHFGHSSKVGARHILDVLEATETGSTN